MHRPGSVLLQEARRVLRVTQNDLSRRLGVSRRTGQRWAKGGPPRMWLPHIAREVFAVAPDLAAEAALAGGTTLEELGLVVRPPPPPPPPPPRVAPHPRVVDAVVCAAAEALHALPQNVRPALLAAFACAKELGLTVEDVEGALRAAGSDTPSA